MNLENKITTIAGLLRSTLDDLVRRHHNGDWGVAHAADCARNDFNREHGGQTDSVFIIPLMAWISTNKNGVTTVKTRTPAGGEIAEYVWDTAADSVKWKKATEYFHGRDDNGSGPSGRQGSTADLHQVQEPSRASGN